MLTLTRNYSEVNTQFSEMNIHSQKNARTMTVYAMSNSPELNSALVIWIAMTRTDGIIHPDHVGQAEKDHCQIP